MTKEDQEWKGERAVIVRHREEVNNEPGGREKFPVRICRLSRVHSWRDPKYVDGRRDR